MNYNFYLSTTLQGLRLAVFVSGACTYFHSLLNAIKNYYIHVVASFPGSTSHVRKKSWEVEPGNEAIPVHVALLHVRVVVVNVSIITQDTISSKITD